MHVMSCKVWFDSSPSQYRVFWRRSTQLLFFQRWTAFLGCSIQRAHAGFHTNSSCAFESWPWAWRFRWFVRRVPEQVCWAGEDLLLKAELRGSRGGVTLNVIVIDMELALPQAQDNRRLEIVADGLPLHGGMQLAMDTTFMSPSSSS